MNEYSCPFAFDEHYCQRSFTRWDSSKRRRFPMQRGHARSPLCYLLSLLLGTFGESKRDQQKRFNRIINNPLHPAKVHPADGLPFVSASNIYCGTGWRSMDVHGISMGGRLRPTKCTCMVRSIKSYEGRALA